MPATIATTQVDPETTPQSSRRHMPGLDVMRGLAILGVLFYHGLGSHASDRPLSGWQYQLLNAFRYGSLGVDLFFVLSGFLITGILVDSRGDANYYKGFYLRRVLRILPAYLLMILVLKVTALISWRYVAVCLLYFCNMSALLGAMPEYGPFWSLSVEEQFYVIWPFLVRNLSIKNLVRLSIAIVVLTPLVRYGLQFGPAVSRDIMYKTWDVADFFGGGALLAVLVRYPEKRSMLRRISAGLLGFSLLSGIVCLLLQRNRLTHAAAAFYFTPFVAFFSCLVLVGFLFPALSTGVAGRVLVFFGNISYGLYLCHQFFLSRIDNWLAYQVSWPLSWFTQLWFRFFLGAAISVLIAFISRYTFEAFFLRMKPKRQKLLHQPQLT